MVKCTIKKCPLKNRCKRFTEDKLPKYKILELRHGEFSFDNDLSWCEQYLQK